MSPLATVCDRHKTLVPVGERCAGCVADESRRRGAKSRRHGVYTARWRARRARKLRRDPLCELRVDGRCAGRASSVHIPAAYRGDHARVPDSELVSACAHCHGVVDGPRAHA